MAGLDIYMCKVTYVWTDGTAESEAETCTNRWFYQQVGGLNENSADELENAFYANVWDYMRAVAPNTISFPQFEVINMMNASDYALTISTVPAVGLRNPEGGVPITPVNNVGLVTNRPNPGVRAGRKRFPFLYREDVVGKRLAFTALVEADWTSFAAAMAAPITFGGVTFQPVIAAPAPGGYGSGAFLRFPITSWTPQFDRIASQDTRKN